MTEAAVTSVVVEKDRTVWYSPSWPPTEADWDVYKPLISELYIDKNAKLDDIRSNLERTYGFRATERMYKNRLKRWKLKKYFSAREKEAVAEVLDACRINGTKAPAFSSDGVSVPLHVVRRHCRRKRIFIQTCEDLPYAPPAKETNYNGEDDLVTEDSTETSSQTASSSITTPSPQYPAPRMNLQRWRSIDDTLDKTQNVLTLVNQYFLWNFDSDLPSKPTKTIFNNNSNPSQDQHARIAMNARSFSDLIGQGLDQLTEGQTGLGWKSINDSCDMLKSVLSEHHHRSLLRFICAQFSDFRWQQRFPDLRRLLLQNIADMSVVVLDQQTPSSSSPLSTIFQLWKDPQVFQNSSKLVLKVILDTCGSRLCTREAGELAREQCNVLRHHRDYSAAESAAGTLVSRCEEIYGHNDAETRRALRRLAHVYMDQRREDKAELVYFDILARGLEILGPAAFPDDSGIFTYQDLARLSTYRGDLDGAERYWRLAYDGAVKLFGVADGPDTSSSSCYCRKHHETLKALKRALHVAKVRNGMREMKMETKNNAVEVERGVGDDNDQRVGFDLPHPWRTVEKVVCVGQDCCTGRYGLINSSWPM